MQQYRTRQVSAPGRGRYTAPQPYAYGNTARKLQEAPPVKAEIIQYRKKISKEAQQNRIAATSMGAGFVCFLAVMSAILVFCCIGYLQAKSELTHKMRAVANLESELETIREDNNEYEAQVTASVDLEKVKHIAIGKLGMGYPTQEQKQTYELPEQGSFVRQYIFNLDN